jgi:hypothetical protein
MIDAIVPLVPRLEEMGIGTRCRHFVWFNGFHIVFADGGEDELNHHAALFCGIGFTMPHCFFLAPVARMLEQHGDWLDVVNGLVRRCHVARRNPTPLERDRIERVIGAFLVAASLYHGDLCIIHHNATMKKAA